MLTSEAHSRLGRLERLFGDPWDARNPVGFEAIVHADERMEMLGPGEALLDEFQIAAEYVPTALGGRFSRLDELIQIVRTVFARDPSLGLGHGVSSLIAVVNVWCAGDDEQRRAAARLLLHNQRIAAAFHELCHGNDLARSELEAERVGTFLHLRGKKEVITNIQRAAALVVVARTAHDRPGRSHSQLLLEKASLSGNRIRYLSRFTSSGMRGVQLGGMEFDECPVDARCILGAPGHGLETTLRAFQVTRTAIPGMFYGIVDRALRTSIRYLEGRRIYAGSATTLPAVQAGLTDVFVDSLRADALTTVAARALHVTPEAGSLYAPVVKYVVSEILLRSVARLASLIGAASYLRTGPTAIFEKLLRDVQPVGFGHIARAACLSAIVPQLAALARRARRSMSPCDPRLHAIRGELPPLRFHDLVTLGTPRENVTPVLLAALDLLGSRADRDAVELETEVRALLTDTRELFATASTLPSSELGVGASAATFELGARFSRLLAASSCVGIWMDAAHSCTPFLEEPAWLLAALRRSADPRRIRAPRTEPRANIYRELMSRYRDGQTFDLARRPTF